MNLKISTSFLLLLFPIVSFSQHINRYKNLERQGKWIIYYDSANTQILETGRYRKGIQKGLWNYYYKDGTKQKQERIVFHKLYTKFYYPSGKLQKKGKARIYYTNKMMHYYFYGVWKVYDENGELEKEQLYKDGNRISETIYKTTKEKGLNDSLILQVRALNQQLYKYTDSLKLAETNFGKNSTQYNRLLQLNRTNSLEVIDAIDKIIIKYGYPGKSLVGKEYALVFSIISSANLEIKEKYYDVIIAAADKGELEWADVVFFVDKVKVAKKEKQIYATQFRSDRSLRKTTYYPIADKPTLNERRKKVGLEEINLNEIDDSLTY